MDARAKPRIDSSRLYIARATPEPGKSKTLSSIGSPPSFGVKVRVSVPSPGTNRSVARYWSPKAWRPTTIGFGQPGTRRGMLLMAIGSRGVAVLDAQVEVLQVDVEVGQDQLVLDELPDDPGHLVAVEFDDGVRDLDLGTGVGHGGSSLRIGNYLDLKIHGCARGSPSGAEPA